MAQQQSTQDNFKNHIQEIDYNRILRILLSRWYWIAGCVFIGITWAFIYLRFTPSVYETSALLKYDDKKTEISELININSYYDRKDKIQSETYVVQSRSLLTRAAKRLNYPYSFYRKGTILETETYPNLPFEVEIVDIDSTSIFNYGFTLSQLNKLKFRLIQKVNGVLISNVELYYGQDITFGRNRIRVLRPLLTENDKDEFLFHFNRPHDLMYRLMGGLNVREVSKGINIMSLTYKDTNPIFAADALNAIITEYRIFDRDQKGVAVSQTIEFIDAQLDKLSGKVKESEQLLEQYKVGNNILNIEDNKKVAYQKLRDLDVQKNIINIQSIAIDLLEEQIKANKEIITLNFSIEGIDDKLMSELVNQMTTLLSERIKKQSLYADNSAPIKEIDRQIEEAKRAIILNIRSA